LNATPSTRKLNPFIRPVLAKLARTLTPAAVSRSANAGALGASWRASLTSRCSFCRDGSTLA